MNKLALILVSVIIIVIAVFFYTRQNDQAKLIKQQILSDIEYGVKARESLSKEIDSNRMNQFLVQQQEYRRQSEQALEDRFNALQQGLDEFVQDQNNRAKKKELEYQSWFMGIENKWNSFRQDQMKIVKSIEAESTSAIKELEQTLLSKLDKSEARALEQFESTQRLKDTIKAQMDNYSLKIETLTREIEKIKFQHEGLVKLLDASRKETQKYKLQADYYKQQLQNKDSSVTPSAASTGTQNR